MKVPKSVEGKVRWLGLLAVLAAVVASAVGLAVWGVRARPGPDGAGVNLDALWRDAEGDFLAGRYDRAEASLARLARARPPTTRDRILRAQIDLRDGRADEALSGLARVPDADPMAGQARLLAGQVELRRHRARRAEVLLRRAAELDPSLPQAHRELVYIYGMLLMRPELRREFLALSAVSALTYDNIFHWCLTRNSTWEPGELTPVLRGFLEADPEDRGARLALAENLRVLGRRVESARVLDALPPEDPDALAVRVDLALDRGDDREAESLLGRGPAGHPNLERLRGRFALSRRDGPAAVRHFRAALDAEPDHRDAVLGLGQALALAGRPQEAAPFQERARAYDALGALVQRAATAAGRADPELWRSLGMACERVGRAPEARAWYSLIIHANPLDGDAQKAVYRLRDAGKPRPVSTPDSPKVPSPAG